MIETSSIRVLKVHLIYDIRLLLIFYLLRQLEVESKDEYSHFKRKIINMHTHAQACTQTHAWSDVQ